jgi:abhydrolase domain-containing protein 12
VKPFFVDWDKPERFGFAKKRVRNLFLTTKDGLRIGAWHILPSSFYKSNLSENLVSEDSTSTLDIEFLQISALKKRPVFIYFHGNAGNRAAPARIETYKRLSERLDVNILTIDYRGFGNSEGSPSEEGLALDARAACDYLISNNGTYYTFFYIDTQNYSNNLCIVDPKNIYILGHSLGTGVATLLARDLGRGGIAAGGLILQAPYISIPDVAFEFNVFQLVPLLKPVSLVPALEGM